jgi:hypothetical protein
MDESYSHPILISKESLTKNSGRSVMVCDDNVNYGLGIPKNSFVLGIFRYDGVNGVYNLERKGELWKLPVHGINSLLVVDNLPY